MKLVSALLCSVLMVLAVPAWADTSRDDAAAIAQRISGARVLSVERAERGGRAVWRVKLVTPRGEVRVILIDVASGRVL
jgi:uncharacterized membrane protein YkoI